MAQNQNDTASTLPQNLDAERSVLGAILLDNSALESATEKLTSGDFCDARHQIIFRAMLALREKQQAIDTLTLFDHLESGKQLSLADGPAYIESLIDGRPNISNVAHYAEIVREKSRLRSLIKKCHTIETQAMERGAESGILSADLLEFAIHSGNGNRIKKLHATNFEEVMLMNVRPIDHVIYPILPTQGLGMLYSKRGMGKTYVALEIGICVAMGYKNCFSWTIPKARPVLYVDGEMPLNSMQERIRALMLGHGLRTVSPERNTLRLITPDLEDRGTMPNISTPQGQRMIEDCMTGDELLMLDNLSCLCRSGKENEGDDWVPVAEWELSLRQRGVSVLNVHHAGKGGEQRGTSRREDLLDCVIAMRPAAEHSAADGLRCEIHMEKMRSSGPADSTYPFELTMQTMPNNGIMWLRRPLKELVEINALAMFADGMSIRDVADELHISKHRAHQIKNMRAKAGG